MAPPCTIAAATMMKMDCREKESVNVRRRLGPSQALSRLKKREPSTKQPIEHNERAQPYGFVF